MSVPLTTPVPNPAIPQPQDQTRQWDAGSTGNTLLDLLARLKEHADAADAAIADAHAHPSLQNVAGAFKDTVLGTLLGLPLNAMDTGSRMLTGAALSTLGNLTPHIASNVPILGGISDMAHQASDAPMRQDPFQDLLARNEAAAAGHGFQVGVINALLNPGNLLGGEGAGAHAFEAGATTLPTIAEHAASLAKQAGKGKKAADFMEQAAQELAQGKPLSDVLASAMQATGKSLGDLTPADKLAAIPADSPFAQHLKGLIAAPGPGGQQALPLVGDAATGTPAAIADILAQTPKPPIDNTQAALQMAVGQGATPTAADIQKALGVGMVEAGRLQDAASGAATKAGDLVAPADKAISPETSALIDKVAPADPAAPTADLDRMDALSGPPLRTLLNDLLTVNYGSAAKKIVNNIAGSGVTFGPDARLLQNGEDVTRSMLDYLLHRSTLDDAGRNALQSRLFPESKVGQAAATADRAPGLSQAEAIATADQPDSADALDAMRNFILHGRGDNGMPQLPNDPGFYTKNVPGITDQQVPSLLKQLQGEGTLGFDARQGYMVKPNDAPGLTQATSVTDGAGNPISQFTPQALDPRAAWQQNYVNQSQAGTDLLAQGGKVAGSDVTQGSMNAMAPADRMAMLQKLAGGDTTAATAVDPAAPHVFNAANGQPFLRAGTVGSPADWLANGNQDVQDYVNFAYRNRDNALARGIAPDPQLPGGIGLPGAPADAVARFSGAYEGQMMHNFGDGDVGWKLHLNVADWNGANTIADFLDKNGIGYKIGRAGDEKLMTVYLGARDNYDKVAQVIDQHFGNLINPIKGGTPQGDEHVLGNIYGRFDTHAPADFQSYGVNGRPILASAPGDAAAGDAAATARYGDFYTGTAPVGATPAAQAPVIAADAPGALGALPANNYTTPLSAYTDTLYRQSHPDEAMAVLDPLRNGSGGNRELYFSNTPDLALGQGANKDGILIEYDPSKVQGQVNMNMPGWQVAWQHGGAEFYNRSIDANSLNGAVRAVTVPPQLALSPGGKMRLSRTLSGLEGQGWQREALADGKVRYTPPDAGTALGNTTASAPVGAVPAVPAAQTPALETVAQVAAKAPEVAPQAVPPEQIIQHIANETVPPPEEIASIVADPTPPADLLNRHVETQHSTDVFSDAADVPPKGGPPRGIMGLLPQVTQGGTTASGGLIGGIAGYQAGNGDGKDPLAGITGGIAGAAIGAGLGNRAFTPGGEQTIKFFGAVAQEMVAAEQNALENGTRKFTFKTIGDQWSQQQIQSPKNAIEEVLSNTLFMLRTGVSYAKAKANFTDLASLYTAGQRDANKLVTTVAKGMHTALGVPDYVPNLGGGAGPQLGYHSETVAHPVQSAINQAVLSAASPASIATSALTGGVPVGALLYGALRGAAQPAITAAYEAFDSIIKASFRSAVYEDALAKQVASDAAPFLQKVQQLTGTVPAALPQSGMFSADTIRTALAQAPSGVADALANEWALTSNQALDTAASFSRQTFGDFSNIRGFEKFIRPLVPFSSFIIRAIPRTLELVQDHPAIAAAYTTQMIVDGQRATAEGRPSSQVGGVPIDSNTPLIGKLADMETGGRGGTAHVNFLSGILPIPTGVFGGMGLDTSGQDAPVYDPSGKMIDQNSNQKQAQLFYMQFADAVAHAGFSVNPIVQMVAYAANWDFKRPGALSKDAEFQQTLPGPRVGSLYAGLDFVRKNIGGGTVNDTTAGDKVLGQLFYDKYGMSMADPRAAKLVAQTMQPDNPLVQQAQDIANKAAISKGTLGEIVPSSILGQTQHELDIQRAQGDQSRVNAALIAQAQSDPQGFQDFMAQLQQRQMMMQNLQRNYPVQYQQLLAQGQTPIKGANPIYGQLVAPQNTSPLLITQGTDAQHRAQQASLAWQQEHQTLAYLAPTVYQAQLGALHNALGLPSQP